MVFGLPAAIILLVTVVGPASFHEVLAGTAWAASLSILALRGFWNEERNAFAPVENRSTDLAPVLLAIFGVVALLDSERVPGVFLMVLAVAWTFAAPSWRPLWKSKAMRFVGNAFQIVHAVVVIAVIVVLIWSWIGK